MHFHVNPREMNTALKYNQKAGPESTAAMYAALGLSRSRKLQEKLISWRNCSRRIPERIPATHIARLNAQWLCWGGVGGIAVESMCRGGGICTMYIRSDSTLRGLGGGEGEGGGRGRGRGRVVVLNGSRTNVQNSGICREIRRRVGRKEGSAACTRLPRRKEWREAVEGGLCQTDRVLEVASSSRTSASINVESLTIARAIMNDQTALSFLSFTHYNSKIAGEIKETEAIAWSCVECSKLEDISLLISGRLGVHWSKSRALIEKSRATDRISCESSSDADTYIDAIVDQDSTHFSA